MHLYLHDNRVDVAFGCSVLKCIDVCDGIECIYSAIPDFMLTEVILRYGLKDIVMLNRFTHDVIDLKIKVPQRQGVSMKQKYQTWRVLYLWLGALL